MTNRFGVVLHSESVRWAAAESVSETVIAAVLLLHERSVEEIVAKLGADELEQVIKLVGRSPSCYPPGTLLQSLPRADNVELLFSYLLTLFAEKGGGGIGEEIVIPGNPHGAY